MATTATSIYVEGERKRERRRGKNTIQRRSNEELMTYDSMTT